MIESHKSIGLHLIKYQTKREVSLGVWRSVSKRLHGEFAQRAKHQEGVFLQDVREAGGAVRTLQSFSVLEESKTVRENLNFHLLKVSDKIKKNKTKKNFKLQFNAFYFMHLNPLMQIDADMY